MNIFKLLLMENKQKRARKEYVGKNYITIKMRIEAHS